MATSIALSPLVPNSSLAGPAGTAADATINTISSGGVPLEEIFVRAVVATATTNVVIKASVNNPPALSAGQGDLTVACLVGTTFLGPFTSGRFMKKDGTFDITTATPGNVTLTAFRLPRTA